MKDSEDDHIPLNKLLRLVFHDREFTLFLLQLLSEVHLRKSFLPSTQFCPLPNQKYSSASPKKVLLSPAPSFSWLQFLFNSSCSPSLLLLPPRRSGGDWTPGHQAVSRGGKGGVRCSSVCGSPDQLLQHSLACVLLPIGTVQLSWLSL